MRAQASNGSVSTGDDPRHVLAGWLDDYAADRCDRDDLQATFISVCQSNTEAPWVALALLDQYQRLGRIDTTLALTLKSEVNQVVFGATQPPTAARCVAPADEQHDTAQREPTQRPEVASKPLVATAQNPVVTAQRSDTRSELRAVEHTASTAIRVEQIQQPREEPVVVPAHRILRQRYELLELISTSATGAVYQALDRQREHLLHDARYVSVQLVRLDEANVVASPADIQQGFYRAQTLAHPNIRSVFDIDREGDTCFAVMELLHGEQLLTLLQHFNGRTIPWHYARNILRGIGAALVYAHDHGVIHGDLQPQNVLITPAGEVKVLEFGFVPLYRPEPWIADGAAAATLHSESARYSSLDRMNAQEPHPSDDVFSLACIAYELLSGRAPYDGRSVSLAERQGHRPSRSARFNQRQWRVLQRALVLKRDDRKISLRELLVGLGCEHAPKPLAPPETLLAKRADRSPWTQPALLTAVSLLVVAWVTYIIAFSPLGKSPQHGEANNPEQLAGEQLPASVTYREAVTSTPTDLPEGASAPAMANRDNPVPTASSNVEHPSAPNIDPAIPASVAATTLPETTNAALSTQTPNISAAQDTNEARSTTTAGSVAFAKDSFVAVEGEGPARVVIYRTGRLNKAVRVRWSLIGDSAKPGEDYADTGSGIVEIPAGVREYTLVIPLASNAVSENTELFTIRLARADDGPPLQEPTTATVIIVDDD